MHIRRLSSQVTMAAAGRWRRQQQQARIMIAGSSSRLAFLPLALLLLLLTAVSVAPAAAAATTAGSRRGLAQLQPDDGNAVDGGGVGGVGDVGTRVVGGRVAPEERLSHQLAVRAGKDGRGLCGAALVAGHVALTAAHCMTSADSGSVVAGAYSRGISGFQDGATAYLRRVLNHPAFKSKPASTPDINDAALLMLDRCPTLGAKVSVIAIASPAELQASAAANANWLVSGWGSTSSGAGKDGTDGALSSKLRYGLMKRFANDCAKANGLKSSKITPDMLCAIGLPKADGLGVPLQDGCQGDSGGPLIFNAQDAVDVLNGTKAADRLAGVVSWGKGCGQLGRAGVFANAALLKDWVEWNADAAPRPSSCPSSANPTATFFLESAARAWSGYKPSSTKKLAATEAATSAAATATCQARCAATINQSKDSCAAFSVTSVTKASKTTYYCSLFTKGVPPRLCDASEKSTVCQQAAVGSWRLKYTYT